MTELDDQGAKEGTEARMQLNVSAARIAENGNKGYGKGRQGLLVIRW